MFFIKKIIYYYSSFSGKAGRVEFSFYLLLEIIANLFAIYLFANFSLDDATIIHLFYNLLIILITLIPIQSATTRRIRDLDINCGYIFINFIPIVNIIFKVCLLTIKGRNKSKKITNL